MGIGRAAEEQGAEPGEDDVAWIRQILCHFLLDRAALLRPALLLVEDALHADGLDMKRHIKVRGRHGEKELRGGLARIGVEAAAHEAADRRQLVGGETRIAAEHHMLLGMRQAGKAGRRLVGADEIVDRRRDHRRQRVAHEDDLEAVRQRRAQNVIGGGRPA